MKSFLVTQDKKVADKLKSLGCQLVSARDNKWFFVNGKALFGLSTEEQTKVARTSILPM